MIGLGVLGTIMFIAFGLIGYRAGVGQYKPPVSKPSRNPPPLWIHPSEISPPPAPPRSPPKPSDPVDECIQAIKDSIDFESRLAALEEWRDAMTLLYGDPTKPRPKGVIYADSRPGFSQNKVDPLP
jgi:hypothetical protein